MSGLLVVADPEDGCGPLKPPHPADLQLDGEAAQAWAAMGLGQNRGGGGGEAPWIALIARTQDREGCTFDVKVRGVWAAQVERWRVAAAAAPLLVRWLPQHADADPRRPARVQVANAESAGAVAAIVYDDV